ncbi:MAG: hypothetical protein N2Z76_06555 [Treponemataceae bacterium]|nr:hypothetical protein [Treponemataceae bacterium]
MKKFLAVMLGSCMVVAGLVAQDLKIDYQFNVAAADPANYFTFQAPMRYHAADKDTFDATTGASKQNSTEMFMPYLYDVQGKQVFPLGLRGLFLFAVAPGELRQSDNLTVSKATSGVITIQYVHRGVAYKIETDRNGKLSFPKGNFVRRQIGFIQGNNPQVLHSDFSADGTAAKVNWTKVWDSSIAAGKEIQAGVATKTGAITDDNGVADAMFRWEGEVQVTFDKNILKISGALKAVKN